MGIPEPSSWLDPLTNSVGWPVLLCPETLQEWGDDLQGPSSGHRGAGLPSCRGDLGEAFHPSSLVTKGPAEPRLLTQKCLQVGGGW